jgi:hypothetical protein
VFKTHAVKLSSEHTSIGTNGLRDKFKKLNNQAFGEDTVQILNKENSEYSLSA